MTTRANISSGARDIKSFSREVLDLNTELYAEKAKTIYVSDLPAPLASFYNSFYPQVKTLEDIFNVFKRLLN